jgi:hypothetical protein
MRSAYRKNGASPKGSPSYSSMPREMAARTAVGMDLHNYTSIVLSQAAAKLQRFNDSSAGDALRDSWPELPKPSPPRIVAQGAALIMKPKCRLEDEAD